MVQLGRGGSLADGSFRAPEVLLVPAFRLADPRRVELLMKTSFLAALFSLPLLVGGAHLIGAESETGFTPLFDGISLKGWHFVGKPGEEYKVRAGSIVCEQGVGGNLFTEPEFENFVLRFEFVCADPGANNGVGIRAPFEGDAAYVGMEIQVLEESGAEAKYGKLHPEQFHGSVYDVFAAKRGAMKPVGQWNTEEIVANGRHLKVTLNGQIITDVDLSTVTDASKLAKHPGLLMERGHIGFLGHNDHVEFRHIRVKELPSAFAKDNTAPYPGFKALYNGQDLTGWKGLLAGPNDNPAKRAALAPEQRAAEQIKADEGMRTHWESVAGALAFDGKGASLCTLRDDYRDFELFVDWKIKEHGDSGIYLRGSPQVQIWDPFTQPAMHGSEVGSGGLYNNQKNPSKPTRVADRPIGQWNHFHLLMQGEKVSVYLNDKLVTPDVTLENYWDRSQPIFPMGQIELQNHGDKLWFKNIYLRELPAR